MAIGLQGAGASASKPAASRHWTVDDILAIPEVIDLALSDDGRSIAYLIRIANVADDRPDFELHVADIDGRMDRVIARSRWIDRLRAIPGRGTFSILADLGAGVQLYAIAPDGETSPLIVNSETVLVGSADGAEFGYTGTLPLRMGVAFYDWSPAGDRLFYSILRSAPSRRQIRTNEAIVDASIRRRWAPTVRVEFYVKERDRVPTPIAEVGDSDRVARFLGGFPTWEPTHLTYALQSDDLSDPHIERYRWSFSDRKTVRVVNEKPQPARQIVLGPRGGNLAIERIGNARHLREHLPDGDIIDYGLTDASIADLRTRGNWRNPAGAFSIVAVRLADEARYALLRLDRSGRTGLIGKRQSLRHCAFRTTVDEGVCIREGLNRPPELVAVSARTGRIKLLRTLSPRHTAIEPLRVDARTLTNAYGFRFRAFVIMPRSFSPGQRAPAVIVTHGSDADERFGAADLQWNYPVQMLAERGYVVILVNDPYPSQSPLLEAANGTWNSCDGRTSPAEVRRLIWLNAIESYRTVIATLSRAGMIDPDRVGIAGYSYGSQMTNVAITQTRLFKAASSGDGGYLEPVSYRHHQCSYGAIYGGPPGDPAALRAYAAFTPSYRARLSSTPLLQQLAVPQEGAIALHQAFRAAGVAAEMSLYPGETPASDETHLFHIPSNQRAAMEENIEWFEFWLRGIAPSAGPDGNRRERWMALRDRAPR